MRRGSLTYRDEVGRLAVLQLDPQPVKVLVAPSHTVLRQVKLYPRCLRKDTHTSASAVLPHIRLEGGHVSVHRSTFRITATVLTLQYSRQRMHINKHTLPLSFSDNTVLKHPPHTLSINTLCSCRAVIFVQGLRAESTTAHIVSVITVFEENPPQLRFSAQV